MTTRCGRRTSKLGDGYCSTGMSAGLEYCTPRCCGVAVVVDCCGSGAHPNESAMTTSAALNLMVCSENFDTGTSLTGLRAKRSIDSKRVYAMQALHRRSAMAQR